MSRLIVPGKSVRPVRKSLTIVRDHRRKRYALCKLCQTWFYEGEETAWVRHAAKCAKENEEMIHEMSPRTRLPMLTPEGGPDPEYERWIADNRQALIEGRLKM